MKDLCKKLRKQRKSFTCFLCKSSKTGIESTSKCLLSFRIFKDVNYFFCPPSSLNIGGREKVGRGEILASYFLIFQFSEPNKVNLTNSMLLYHMVLLKHSASEHISVPCLPLTFEYFSWLRDHIVPFNITGFLQTEREQIPW